MRDDFKTKTVDLIQINSLIKRIVDTKESTFDATQAIQLKGLIDQITTAEIGNHKWDRFTKKKKLPGVSIIEPSPNLAMPEFTVVPKRLQGFFSGAVYEIYDKRRGSIADRVGNSYQLKFKLLSGKPVEMKKLEVVDVPSSFGKITGVDASLRYAISKTFPSWIHDPSLDYRPWKKSNRASFEQVKNLTLIFCGTALPEKLYQPVVRLIDKSKKDNSYKMKY